MPYTFLQHLAVGVSAGLTALSATVPDDACGPCPSCDRCPSQYPGWNGYIMLHPAILTAGVAGAIMMTCAVVIPAVVMWQSRERASGRLNPYGEQDDWSEDDEDGSDAASAPCKEGWQSSDEEESD